MTSTQLALPPESPFGRLFLPLLAVTMGGLYLVSRHPFAPAPFTAIMGILGLGFLPGLGLALWTERRFGLWASWILPLVLSPVLSVGIGLVLAWFGVGLDMSPRWIVLGSVVAILFAPQPQREIEEWTVSMEMPGFMRHRSDRQQVVLLAALVLAVLAVPLLSREWLRITGDAGFHILAVKEVERGLPPQDPFLAGIQLRYFWGFHVYLAMLETSARVGAEFLLVGGSLIGAFSVVFCAYRLLGQLGLGHARALWGTIGLFFSLNGLFWVFDLIGRAAGSGYATAEGGWWQAQMALFSRPQEVMFPGLELARTFFLEPFLRGGPLVPGLVFALLFAMATVGSVGESRWRWGFYAFLSGVGLMLFHSGLGAMVFAATLLAIPFGWLVAGLHPFRKPGAELWTFLPPMILAVAVTSPYLHAVTRHGDLVITELLLFSPGKALATLAPVAVVLILGFTVLGRFLVASDARRPLWTVWCVMLLVVVLLARFPGDRPLHSPVFLLQVFFGLTAGSMIPVLWSRRPVPVKALVVLLALVVLVPRTTLGVAAYLRAPDPRDRSAATLQARDWIRRNTPMDAVLVDYNPDLALATLRPLFQGPQRHLHVLGYRAGAVSARGTVFASVLTGAQISDAGLRALGSVRAPLFYVQRLPESARISPPPGSELAFENAGFAIYRWTPPEPPGMTTP